MTRAMIHAEKETKRPSTKYAWSLKLREAELLVRYWHLRIRELETGPSLLTATILRTQQRLRTLQISLYDNLGNNGTKLVKIKWKESIATLKNEYRCV